MALAAPYLVEVVATGSRSRLGDTKVWFTSMRSLAEVLSDENRALLRTIRETRPVSIASLAETADRHGHGVPHRRGLTAGDGRERVRPHRPSARSGICLVSASMFFSFPGGSNMSEKLAEIEAQALQLSPRERGELAHRLIVSLDAPADDEPESIAKAWDEEIGRRVADMDAGRTQWVSADAVMQKMREHIAAARTAHVD